MSTTAGALPTATWRDWLSLTKPKVVSLLLFTAVLAMWIAERGLPGWLPLVSLLAGGYMFSGGASVFNMILERDIDARMKRTARRPLVTGMISVRGALLFGTTLSTGAFFILWLGANSLAALSGLAGLLFYVFVYTIWLKRRTWQNIVIGGAAGAASPLTGWAAATGELTPLAWILFALVFLWTPVHFWALAFLVKDQYIEVGVPMAPGVLGTRRTLQHMSLYTVLTILVSLLPLALREASWLYAGSAALLNLLLLIRMWRLWQRSAQVVTREDALSLYKFSMLYLALVFLTLGLDRSLAFLA